MSNVGHCASIAYQTAFSINVLLQLAALVWFIAPWPKELNSKSQIALKRKSRDQSRSVHVVIPSTESVILETDRDVSGELGLALPGFPPRRSTGAPRTSGRLIA
ncbi:hypothetical protein QA633_08490 [Bradyrhizobium barranii]|uniref:hypothetical protein n=1 Tax=Bradyrhizobium barranii TaxID=2992140 RepID=UPI0024B1458A|nr:hypothetical protein [Bradyrhizobium barranii]WFT97065.1 hypothetical protein QA633_08490 [Bradyrhizobium barranii]